MRKLTIKLKNGNEFVVQTEQDIDMIAFNNYSDFVEVVGHDGDRLILAKDAIESVKILQMQEDSNRIFKECIDKMHNFSVNLKVALDESFDLNSL